MGGWSRVGSPAAQVSGLCRKRTDSAMILIRVKHTKSLKWKIRRRERASEKNEERRRRGRAGRKKRGEREEGQPPSTASLSTSSFSASSSRD